MESFEPTLAGVACSVGVQVQLTGSFNLTHMMMHLQLSNNELASSQPVTLDDGDVGPSKTDRMTVYRIQFIIPVSVKV